MRRRAGVVGVIAMLLVALVACAGLPTAGPIHPGQAVTSDENPLEVVFVPAGPTVDATPEQIVEGFIAAGSGTRGNWATAQEFLTPDFREQWRPQAGVTVYRAGSRALTPVSETEISVAVDPEATVDATGAYSIATGEELTLDFQLVRIGGQWRISQAPDGIALDVARFASVFRSYSLEYFDPTWTRLVPEVRWFPLENAATSIAGALVEGAPSPWLAASVATAFTPDIGLTRSVPVNAGVAQVSFGPEARGLDQVALDRMQTQLEASLADAGIAAVDMLVDGEVLVADPVPTLRTVVDARPLVLTDTAFGFLSNAQIEPIAGLSAAILEADAAAIDVAPSRTEAAVLTSTGVVRRVTADGAVTDVDTRAGLAGPSIDPDGFIWSVPESDPTAVIAGGADGTVHEVANAWAGAVRISAMRVSRDGTRVAGIVQDGTRTALWVAGIVRDDDGVPLELGQRVLVAELPADGVDLVWLSGSRLAVAGVTADQGYFIEAPVGGPPGRVRAPLGVTTLDGGSQSGTIRLRDSEGDLYVQRGASWQLQAPGILVLATQQGQPR